MHSMWAAIHSQLMTVPGETSNQRNTLRRPAAASLPLTVSSPDQLFNLRRNRGGVPRDRDQ